MKESEILARRTLEDLGFEAHDANVLFKANCPNIDLVVYGRERAIYVQVKSSSNPAGKGCIVVDGTPWTEEQLYEKEPIYNRRPGFRAQLVMLVDHHDDGVDFYLAPPADLERAVREKGRLFADKPKRDGTKRSIKFRKELSRERLKPWLNAWHLLGEPVRS